MDSKNWAQPLVIITIIFLTVGNIFHVLYTKNLEMKVESYQDKLAELDASYKALVKRVFSDETLSGTPRAPGESDRDNEDPAGLKNNKHELRHLRRMPISEAQHGKYIKKVTSLPRGPSKAASFHRLFSPPLQGFNGGNVAYEQEEVHYIQKRAIRRKKKGQKQRKCCKKGRRGQKGEPGIRGVEGVRGKAGPKGEKGSIGDMGFMGRKGDKGERGDKGYKGDTGAKGAQGEPGRLPATELIHLVGASTSRSSKLDLTHARTREEARFKFWNTEARQGNIGYENGYINIKVTGYYYVYCQIHYSGRFKFNRHVVKKNGYELLLLGLETFRMPTNFLDETSSTKFTGGIFRLNSGDKISVNGIATKYTLNRASMYFGAYLVHQ